VLKTQKPRPQKPLLLQFYHQLNIPIKMLLLETTPLMLSLLETSESVPKPLEPHQYTFQPQHSHLKHLMFLKQLDSPKLNQLPQPPQLQELQTLTILLNHQLNILINQLLLETTLLMLSLLKKLRLVFKLLQLTQFTLILQLSQFPPQSGLKLASIKKAFKNYENSVE
jgi:hypothetical protein